MLHCSKPTLIPDLNKGDRMYSAPEQLIAWNKANFETAVRFAGIALEGAQRLTELQSRTLKNAFAEGVQQVRALAEIKTPQELAQFKAASVQPAWEKAAS